jgi:hypothetical protein
MVNSEYMVPVLWCLSTRYLLLPWLVISAVCRASVLLCSCEPRHVCTCRACVPNEQTSSTSKEISLHRASATEGDIMITMLMKTVSVPQSVLRYDSKYWALQDQNVPRADDSTRLYSAEAESSIANMGK